jgi:hypothetical protein
MKRSILLLLMLFVLSVGVLPVSAQNDCNLDISGVYAILGQAQGQAASGDKEAALNSILEADIMLQEVMTNCGFNISADTTTATTTTTTSAPRPDGRIVMFIDGSSNGFNGFSLMGSLAFVNGYNLDMYDYIGDFIDELDEPDVAGAIFSSRRSNEQNSGIEALSTFAANGGRVIVFYDAEFEEHNEILQDSFGVAVAIENVSIDDEMFLYPSEALPSWLSGLEVGVDDDSEYGINSYLATPLQGSEMLYLPSPDNGRERLVFFTSADETFTFMHNIAPSTGKHYFFADDFLETHDNEEATLAMFDFLLGN